MDLVDVVDERLPGWRSHRPYRTRAAAWPTRSTSVGGRAVELFSSPAVGTTWLRRGSRYWWRRVSRRSGLPTPLPSWARGIGATLGTLGAALTPLFTLGLLVDLLPRFPVQERVAWEFVVGQSSAGSHPAPD